MYGALWGGVSYTVEPPLSGHPRGSALRPNRGDRLIKGYFIVIVLQILWDFEILWDFQQSIRQSLYLNSSIQSLYYSTTVEFLFSRKKNAFALCIS
jgi:hypothetical protein